MWICLGAILGYFQEKLLFFHKTVGFFNFRKNTIFSPNVTFVLVQWDVTIELQKYFMIMDTPYTTPVFISHVFIMIFFNRFQNGYQITSTEK